MNTRLPSTKNLQAFLSTVYYLNFTHAAEALNMTQGAISRQIQTLEEIMGVQLFYRQARGLSLTPEGDKFVPLAEDIIKRLQMSIREVADSANRIKLNAPSCITSWLLSRIANFQQAYPDVNVELTSTTKHEAVPNFDSFDLIITYGKPTRSKVVNQTLLFEEFLAPVCAPELWQQIVENGDKDVLNQFTWLHANQEQSDWKLWLESHGNTRLKGKGNQTFATLDQAMNAAQQGFGVAIGDLTLAAQDLKLKRLIQPFDLSVTTGNGYHLLHLREQGNEMVSKLIEWLTERNQ
ncbi:LysR substrate-binding domain-containing protein [Vibrio tubiashii]|uniref:LysR substrate-binding domain-containing protein n=1 Tax=Vibrio tubiashii TaxID=29498 RepID=UPI001EFEF124|nr:LysR substrate-binding domain-containing protein [Vibrio tubiashii]MCG9575849.1 LysR substrate-binding domain-containing protein [Vibrio tubiashii]